MQSTTSDAAPEPSAAAAGSEDGSDARTAPRRRLTRLPGWARSACYLIGHTHGTVEQNQPSPLR